MEAFALFSAFHVCFVDTRRRESCLDSDSMAARSHGRRGSERWRSRARARERVCVCECASVRTVVCVCVCVGTRSAENACGRIHRAPRRRICDACRLHRHQHAAAAATPAVTMTAAPLPMQPVTDGDEDARMADATSTVGPKTERPAACARGPAIPFLPSHRLHAAAPCSRRPRVRPHGRHAACSTRAHTRSSVRHARGPRARSIVPAAASPGRRHGGPASAYDARHGASRAAGGAGGARR